MQEDAKDLTVRAQLAHQQLLPSGGLEEREVAAGEGRAEVERGPSARRE